MDGKDLPLSKFDPRAEENSYYQPRMEGRKDDGGKIDMTLFDDMPRALKAVAEVMQWAITKKEPTPYDRGSWLGVSADRYRAAQQRHNQAQGEQASMPHPAPTKYTHAPRFQRDPETSLLHEAHKACSALFALELILRELEGSNVPE